MMGIPNEHQLKFNFIKDAKKLLEAVEKRFGGNATTKKTQRNLLKQQYENFTTPSSEMLDQTFNRLQNLVSQLELLKEKLSQEDVNQKLLRSLSPEWNTHVIMWRNKADLDTMRLDDLYNNLKVYEPEVKGLSSSSSSTQNMAFVSSLNNNTSSTNGAVNTAQAVNITYGVSTSSTQVNAAYSTNINNLNDIEEIDLRRQMAMLTMRARRFLKKTGKNLTVNGNKTIGFDKSNVECYNCHKREHFARKYLVSCDGLSGYDWSDQAEEGQNYALMAFSSSSSDLTAKAVNTACYVQNRVLVVKSYNKTLYELFHGRTPTLSLVGLFGCPVTLLNTIDHLRKFDGKADEGFFVGYSLNSKAFRVFNSITMVVEENLHIRFSKSAPNVLGSGLDWLFDIDVLTITMNYEPIVAGTQSNGFVDPKSSNDEGSKPSSDDGKKVDEDPRKENECNDQEKEDNVNNTNNVNTVSSTVNTTGINRVNDVGENISIELEIDPNMPALEDVSTFYFLRNDEDDGGMADMNNLNTTIQVSPILTTRIHKDHPLDQVIRDLQLATQTRKMSKNLEEHGNKVRLVAQGYTQEELIDYDEVFAHVARIEAIRLFLAYASSKDFVVYQMDVKSDFLYGKIEEEVLTKKELCFAFKKLMHEKFQMSSMGELTFFLELQVKHRKDGTFISQDKYIAKILKKFRFTEVKTASTPMETQKPLLKDKDGEEVDVHMYRSMIGSFMYLTFSRPDIMFAVCAYARYQVNPKVSHLYSMKRISRVLDLKKIKTTQQQEIASLKRRIKKLEKRNRRRIDAIDADKDITLVNDADHEMFDVDTLVGKEVFVARQNENVVEEVVDATQVSTAVTTVTITTEEITLAQALKALRTSKPKVKWIVFQEPGKSTTTTIISSQQSHEKGKRIMIEEHVKPKKKDQIRLDEEAAKRLQAEFDEEKKTSDDAILLAVKSPRIVDWKIHKEGKKSYYQIVRADGKSQMYTIFSQLLKIFNKEDLEDLHKLVKARYGSTRPVENMDYLLWSDIKTMFEPHVEDEIWKMQQGYKVLE
nr:hypothetical protein [Tanacetum cinerariifolium]